MSYGWRGKRVRHQDGREGVIKREDGWFAGVDLIIEVNDAPEGTAQSCVKLNATSADGGEPGWFWWCEEFSGGARWLPLGDHWVPPVDINQPA